MRLIDRRSALLLSLAAVPPAVSFAVTNSLGYEGAKGLAPQLTAVWPYDSYHDMRWLLIYHDSWVAFAVVLLGIVVARGLLTAVLVALAWPENHPRPPLKALVLRNMGVAVLGAVIISPYAALAVMASVVSLSWFLFVSLIPMVMIAPFLQRAGVTAGWWRSLPSLPLVGWSTLDFGALTFAGALAWSVPGWWPLLVVLGTGLVNGLLWQRTVTAAVTGPAPALRWLPAAPVAFLLALAVPVGAQAAAPEPPQVRQNWRPLLLTRDLPDSVRYAVIVLGGHDSAYDGRPTGDPIMEQFSYEGIDGNGRPRPYGPDATHRSIDSAVELLDAHVDSLHRRTGQPVALIGESAGALVARRYLERFPDSPVTALAMFSPPIRAGRNYYPPPDHDTGWGLVTGWQLRLLFAMGRTIRYTTTSPDEPFIRSIMDNGPFYRFQLPCPVEGVRMIMFLPTVTAAEAPPGEYTGIPVYQEHGFHGQLLDWPEVDARLEDWLSGVDVHQKLFEYVPIQRLAAAWQAPGLALSVNPVWRGQFPPGVRIRVPLCGL